MLVVGGMKRMRKIWNSPVIRGIALSGNVGPMKLENSDLHCGGEEYRLWNKSSPDASHHESLV